MNDVNTAARVHEWVKSNLDSQLAIFGTKSALYRHLEQNFDLSRDTVNHVWTNKKANPKRDTLDALVKALKKMNGKSKRAKNGQQ